MYFDEAIKEYLINFPTALAFALLLIFVLPLTFFKEIFISSGLIGFEYGLSQINIFMLFFLFVLIALFVFFYALFVSLMVFAVRKDLSKVKIHYYLNQKITKFSFNLFIFYFMYFISFFILGFLLIFFKVPLIVVSILMILSSFLFFYLPQALVVDETGIRNSFFSGLDFFSKNILYSFKIFLFGSFIVLFITLLEFIIDSFFPGIGPFISLLISFVFIVPFIECWKTVLFMLKFDLIKSSLQKFTPTEFKKQDRLDYSYLKKPSSKIKGIQEK